MNKINPTAQISQNAEIAEGAEIRAYAIIKDGVRIGANTVIESHCVIENSSIGENCFISASAMIGLPPQDLGYKGEPTRVEIGNNVKIAEFSTIQRGTVKGSGVTRIGDNAFIMVYSHIAHDCSVGDSVIFANNVTLGGHVKVHRKANLSAFFIVHQNVEIGELVMGSALTATARSIPPFVVVTGKEGGGARIVKINTIGLERNGVSKDEINAIRESYRVLKKKPTKDAIIEIREKAASESFERLNKIADFYEKVKVPCVPFYTLR